MVSNVGHRKSRKNGGKPPQLYQFEPGARYAIGIQLSFDSLHCKLVDVNSKPVKEFTAPIDHDVTIDTLLRLVNAAISAVTSDIPPASVVGMGFGSHGVTDLEKGVVVTSPHNPSWGNFLELKNLIAARTGAQFPVYVDNAVRYRTLAEMTVGCLRTAKDAIVIHTSEGVIAGVMIDGRVRRGLNNLAGAVGHVTVNVEDTDICVCGGTGCFEMQIAPARVVQRSSFESIRSADGFPESGTAESLLFYVCELADSGNQDACAVISEVAGWFAIAIHNLILTVDPEAVVIQGTYARAGSFFLSELQSRLNRVSLTNVKPRTRVEYSRLREDAAAIGGATYAMQRFLDRVTAD